MCGFTGFLDPIGQLKNPKEQLRNMTRTLAHRGPNDEGIWFDTETGVGLGHRRLSIVDLSPEGHQPMISTCGRYVIAYNGEIYNYLEIKKELDKCNGNTLKTWRGHSDTEIALAAIAAWGIVEALERFNGMFAFALWDRKGRVLYLARDRLGEKPVYYGWMGRVFIFSSELKAIRENSAFNGEIDRNALTMFFRYNNVPAPNSIYKQIYKLPVASFIKISHDTRNTNYDNSTTETAHILNSVTYWQSANIVESGVKSYFNLPASEMANEIEQLLIDSVKIRMEADVPLGAFLSGGIDSSIVVALMQAQSTQPVKTFTIGSHNLAYDEAVTARAVAKYLGTDHTELYVTPDEVINVIPKLPNMYDEPFADASQIPTYLVSVLARQHVTVSLSGDGGDELFAGYNRHFMARNIWQKIRHIPLPLRRSLGRAMMAISPLTWNRMSLIARKYLSHRIRQGLPGNRLHKLASALASKSPEDMYLALLSNWENPELIVKDGTEPWTVITKPPQLSRKLEYTERMMFLDLVNYLPDDILVKLDRASMSVGLESRVPFLDPRLVELSWRVPLHMKIRNGQGKWILRQLLYKHVPQELVDRPKQGFGLPIDDWLRVPLRDWAESLLDENRLRQEGYLNPAPIRQEWHNHLTGKRNSHQKLWGVLMFQSWLNATH